MAQGGSAVGCGVPASAKAVAITLHAQSMKTSYLTAFADGSPLPPTWIAMIRRSRSFASTNLRANSPVRNGRLKRSREIVEKLARCAEARRGGTSADGSKARRPEDG